MNFDIIHGKKIRGAYISIEPFFYEEWGEEHHEESIHIYEDNFLVPGYLLSLFQNRYDPYEITYLGRKNGNEIANIFEEFGLILKNGMNIKLLAEKYIENEQHQKWVVDQVKENPQQIAVLLLELARYFRDFLKRSEVVSIVGI